MAPKLRSSTKKRDPLPLILAAVSKRLGKNLRVRRTLPDIGRLHIDRQLPFLCVYRQPTRDEDRGTEQLVKAEASYLLVNNAKASKGDVSKVVYSVAKTLSAEFGAFLIVEITSAPDGGRGNDPAAPEVLPTFTLHAAPTKAISRTVDAVARRLKRLKVLKQGVEVAIERDGKTTPAEMRPLLTQKQAAELNCFFLRVVVPPVYRKANSTQEFPLLARAFRRSVSLALRQGYYEFARSCTSHRPAHYHALGRKAVVKAVWDVDRRLAAVSNKFDYLLQLTPVNTTSAWNQFKRSKYKQVPEFHYRPLPVDPAALKRELFSIPIHQVEDPALHRLFREKQEEIELKLTMLRDRDTRKFLFESLQLFGGVGDELYAESKQLLDSLPERTVATKGEPIGAAEFAQQAQREFKLYQQEVRNFSAEAVVKKDVSGVIVSRGKLLINADMSLPQERVAALLAHEVGTHLVTYYNGKAQPFQQLYSGLAGYEELQEGLAVLAEYLVGGLTRSRMRQLAGRVVAVRHLTNGASFVETYRVLDKDYGFTGRAAYNITMRVYRGGGLTKDAVYMRGLQAILRYVQKGEDLSPLFVGKLATEHIPIIKELQYRKVLSPPAIMPHYLQDETAIERLDALRQGSGGVAQLVCKGA